MSASERTQPSAGALGAFRVIELGMYGSAPICSMLLADFGADVIKVEPPEGDFYRQLPPFEQGESHYFMSVNRNKRSVVLDLKTDSGRQALGKLIASADVLVENFRPGVLTRLGFGYEQCAQLNPALVYCSISGFGQTGPQREEPGLDLIVQGYSGMMLSSGEDNQAPFKIAPAVPDVMGGQSAAYAILAALLARERSGLGQFVDISLLDTSIFSMQLVYLPQWLGSGESPARNGSGHPSMVPMQAFRAGDGRWFNLVGNTDRMWSAACKAMGRDDLSVDPRFATNAGRTANRRELLGILEPLFATRSAHDWVELFKEAGIPCGPVNDLAQAMATPQVKAREMLVDMPHPRLGHVKTIGIAPKLTATPGTLRRHAPGLGEHTEEVLREISGGD